MRNLFRPEPKESGPEVSKLAAKASKASCRAPRQHAGFQIRTRLPLPAGGAMGATSVTAIMQPIKTAVADYAVLLP